jgi:hypothetical protein
MTPEEYERRPEVRAALKLVRSRPELRRAGGWASYANRLMDALDIHPEERKYEGGWKMPLEFMYASKRVTAGWSAKDAFNRIVRPTLKSDIPGLSGARGIPILFHGTLLEHVPAILRDGIERGEGWGGAGTSGAFLSGTLEGALYWAKMAYQREHGEKLEAHSFDRDRGHEIDRLLAVLAVQIPNDQAELLRADEEQFEDVHADFPPEDWRQSLKVIGDVRFDGEVLPEWIVEVISPKVARSGL